MLSRTVSRSLHWTAGITQLQLSNMLSRVPRLSLLPRPDSLSLSQTCFARALTLPVRLVAITAPWTDGRGHRRVNHGRKLFHSNAAHATKYLTRRSTRDLTTEQPSASLGSHVIKRIAKETAMHDQGDCPICLRRSLSQWSWIEAYGTMVCRRCKNAHAKFTEKRSSLHKCPELFAKHRRFLVQHPLSQKHSRADCPVCLRLCEKGEEWRWIEAFGTSVCRRCYNSYWYAAKRSTLTTEASQTVLENHRIWTRDKQRRASFHSCQFCETAPGDRHGKRPLHGIKVYDEHFAKARDSSQHVYLICNSCRGLHRNDVTGASIFQEQIFHSVEELVVFARWRKDKKGHFSRSDKRTIIANLLANGASGVPSDGFGNIPPSTTIECEHHSDKAQLETTSSYRQQLHRARPVTKPLHGEKP